MAPEHKRLSRYSTLPLQQIMELPTLKSYMKRREKERANYKIYIRGDQDVPYREVMRVFDLCRRLQKREVVLQTYKVDKAKP